MASLDDTEGLSDLDIFVDEGMRSQPPVFLGRDAVINDIERAARVVYAKWASGSIDRKDPGMTRLVQGPPGSGKTSLLRHLQQRWEGEPGPRRPIAVRLGAGALETREKMQQQLEGQISRSVMDKGGISCSGPSSAWSPAPLPAHWIQWPKRPPRPCGKGCLLRTRPSS